MLSSGDTDVSINLAIVLIFYSNYSECTVGGDTLLGPYFLYCMNLMA